jgi:hypothetical protein
MTILPKAIYMFNTIPFEIPMIFCTEIRKTIMKCKWKHKKPQIAKAVLSKFQCKNSKHNIPLQILLNFMERCNIHSKTKLVRRLNV